MGESDGRHHSLGKGSFLRVEEWAPVCAEAANAEGLTVQQRGPQGVGPEGRAAQTEPPCGPPVTGMSCGNHHIGYMFLGEVALGREHHITIDEPSLKKPPPGFDSVIARGHTEPGESQP